LSDFLGALLHFIVRLFFFVLGAFFFIVLLAFMLLLLALWMLRALWARITGKPISPWAVRMDPMEGWRRTVHRNMGRNAGTGGDPKNSIIIDVDAHETSSVDEEKSSES
jgi:Zn-dependent protease with chaperone function